MTDIDDDTAQNKYRSVSLEYAGSHCFTYAYCQPRFVYK